MLEAFTYAALAKNREALPRLLELLPEAQRSEVTRIVAEAGALTPVELAGRIDALRVADLNEAEAAIGMAQSWPGVLLEWKYRQVRRLEGRDGS